MQVVFCPVPVLIVLGLQLIRRTVSHSQSKETRGSCLSVHWTSCFWKSDGPMIFDNVQIDPDESVCDLYSVIHCRWRNSQKLLIGPLDFLGPFTVNCIEPLVLNTGEDALNYNA